MAARPRPAGPRRPRPGSLERPVNGRMYRGTWLLVGIPLLAAAFSVSQPAALPRPALPPTFDGAAARALALQLVRVFPDRSPGALGAQGAEQWVTDRLRSYGFVPEAQRFEATIPGRGRVQLTNVVAEASGRSRETIAVIAHRDDSGEGVGANDNASGTGALLELARAYARRSAGTPAAPVRPSHTLMFVSTDGGAFGALGAAALAADRRLANRLVTVVVLDSIAGGKPRLVFAGDTPRTPSPALLATASARLLEESGTLPARPSALRQLVDLGLPFSLHEQAPFVALGIPAVTLTSGDERAPNPFADSRLNPRRLAEVGRSADSLVRSLDEGLTLRGGGGGTLVLGQRTIAGWAVQLALIAALLPFLAAAIDLFARCRRRRIALAPALRSLRTRLGFWLVVGVGLWLLALAGAWPEGTARPLSPQSETATQWRLGPLLVLGLGAVLVWLIVRQRLLPQRRATAAEEVAAYTVALLALGVLGLVTIATNVYALVFLLPSLHAWLWLPQVQTSRAWLRVSLLLLGLVGPLLMLGSFAIRHGLGLDAPWYLLALTSVGYIDPAAVALALAWAAAAAQLVVVVAHRYAPDPQGRRGGGALLALVRSFRARRRRAALAAVDGADAAEL